MTLLSSRVVRQRSLLLMALAVLLLPACSPPGFVSKRYGNFTAYYNKFYNAQNAYEAGVEGLERENQPVDRTQFLPLFTGGEAVRSASAGGAGGTSFEDAIKKSADVLRKRPDSKWVDDALMLIGKARFHQGNYVGAEEKFREVLLLDTRLDDEVRFWLARTLAAAQQYDAAEAHLRESLAREDLEPRYEALLRLVLGELHVRRGEWDLAADELAAGLERVRDREIAARAEYLLGQVHARRGAYAEAVEAFDRVRRHKPPYELAYAAQVSALHELTHHLDPDEALQRLRRMERDDKNFSYRGELMYLRARIYHAQGQTDDALTLYDDLLYDTNLRQAGVNTASLQGPIHYSLGELFRDVYDDYILAAAHFDTAATRLGMGGGSRGPRLDERLFSAEAITDAGDVADVFDQFATVMEDVYRMDSLLYLGSLDDEAFAEEVLRLRQLEADRLAQQQRDLDRANAQQRFAGGGGGVNNRPLGAAAAGSAESGFLAHRDPIQVQQNLEAFFITWGQRPLVPGWRRQAAVDAFVESQESIDGDPVGTTIRTPTADAFGLPQIDLSGVPRDEAFRAQMLADRAMARYELANVLFLQMDEPDSAAVWYRTVIEQDADQPVAQRAYYALAEVQQALQDTAAARRIYEDILTNHPDSDFSGRVREQLGLPTLERVETDSTTLARQAYDRAYARWRLGRHATALDSMVAIAVAYPETEVAPQALLAAGAIYSEWATQDSLDLFARLPVSAPDSVLLDVGILQLPPEPAPAAQPRQEEAADSADIGRVPDKRSRVPDKTRRVPDKTSGEADTAGKVPEKRNNAPAEADASADEESRTPVKVRTPVTVRRPGEEGDAQPQTPAEARAAVAAFDEQATTEQTPTEQAAAQAPAAVAAADSAAILGLAAAADSLLADSLLAGDPGARPLLPDSIDLGAAPADTAAAEPETLRLETLYAGVAARYAGSPYAERAARVLEALQDRKQALQAYADSLARVADSLAFAADSALIAPDSLSVPDSLQSPLKPGTPDADADADSLAAASEATPHEGDDARGAEVAEAGAEPVAEPEPSPPPAQPAAAPPETTDERPAAAAQEPDPLQQPPPGSEPAAEAPAEPYWTIVVASLPTPSDADDLAAELAELLVEHDHVSRVLPATDLGRYRVAVGTFATEADATAARQALSALLPDDAWLHRVDGRGAGAE